MLPKIAASCLFRRPFASNHPLHPPAILDAPAIHLSREECDDHKFHVKSLSVWLEIFPEAGKSCVDIEFGYDQSRIFSVRSIEGRTVPQQWYGCDRD